MNVLISTENMGREEWLKFRNRGIGGSDASVIVLRIPPVIQVVPKSLQL